MMCSVLGYRAKNSTYFQNIVLDNFCHKVTESEFKKLRILVGGLVPDYQIRDDIQETVVELLKVKENLEKEERTREIFNEYLNEATGIDKEKILYQIHLKYKNEHTMRQANKPKTDPRLIQ